MGTTGIPVVGCDRPVDADRQVGSAVWLLRLSAARRRRLAGSRCAGSHLRPGWAARRGGTGRPMAATVLIGEYECLPAGPSACAESETAMPASEPPPPASRQTPHRSTRRQTPHRSTRRPARHRRIGRSSGRLIRSSGAALAAVLLGLALSPPVATAATARDSQPPTTPGTPTVVTISTTSVTLTWTASTDNVAVAGYEVAQLHTDYILMRTTSSNEITIDGLRPSNTYQFWVYARDAAGNRSPSSPGLRLTMPPGDDQPPTAPANPVATQIGTDSVTLRWQPSTDNVYVAWYEVLRIHPDGSTTRVAVAPQHPRYR
jgi:chitodextrinase